MLFLNPKSGSRILFAISITAILCINSSYAQSPDAFKTYTNKYLGFTIEHPSNWKVDEDIRKSDTQIHFTIRESEVKEEDNPFPHLPANFWDSYLKVGVDEIEGNPDTDPMTVTVENISIAERVQQDIDFMSFYPDRFGLIGQHQVTVGGNPGWKVEYKWKEGNVDRYVFDIYTKANGKFYVLHYVEVPLKVPESLPLANKMVQSFQFIK